MSHFNFFFTEKNSLMSSTKTLVDIVIGFTLIDIDNALIYVLIHL